MGCSTFNDTSFQIYKHVNLIILTMLLAVFCLFNDISCKLSHRLKAVSPHDVVLLPFTFDVFLSYHKDHHHYALEAVSFVET